MSARDCDVSCVTFQGGRARKTLTHYPVSPLTKVRVDALADSVPVCLAIRNTENTCSSFAREEKEVEGSNSIQ